MSIPAWNVEMDYIEACNCEFGCPCNFHGYPSHGSCQTMVGYHIRSGRYGDTALDVYQRVYGDDHWMTWSYVPLIYELSFCYGDPHSNIPITFADGIPARLSRPGRALRGWLLWMVGVMDESQQLQLIVESHP